MIFKKKKNKINIVRLSGIITAEGKKNLSLKNVKPLIDKAFGSKKTSKRSKVVAFVINSPGGSPVQSEMIANYIRQKAQETSTKVICFVEDVAASGGYWLALIGDEIYTLSKSSIVGSLGVVHASFGLEDFIKDHGIKRRVYTAGERKVTLDMFQEENKEDVARLKILLNEIHQHFKDWVLQRRGSIINLDHNDLFSGEYWVASQGKQYGLVDGIVVDIESKLKELYGEDIKINYVEPAKSFFSFLPFMAGIRNEIQETLTQLKNEVMHSSFNLK